MSRTLVFIYGILCYLIFNAVFIYFIGFLGDFIVPKTIDFGGNDLPLVQAVAINFCLIALFGLQHSLMARSGFKHWWLKKVPIQLERSTYVLLSSLLLLIIFWWWQPVPTVIWKVTHPLGYWAMIGLFSGGWLFTLYATFLINHYDLMGLRQTYLYWRGQAYTPVQLSVKSVYNYIRHPIMLGTLICLWATPSMTVGHLLFAGGFSIYIFIGIYFEEQDMLNIEGEFYQKYRQKTSMLMPIFTRK